ncbi:PREDICTED: olee1-like protein [Nicotiana attenuata]|uniref:Pollen-specific protein-like protein n=1 Tax=Nicotiana attenuata TaxID=49451 RepID=A0A1J6JWR8_NICAT|nr:PREDICTED: olee1-like protein [Nicotiana attenuata]OIT22194.1 pollen-specific protein-like protein [Nicotiana attenuata]
MAKSAVIFFVSAICLFSLLGLTQAYEKPQFIVEGIVYCDPCRSAFKTNLSQPLAGAGVRLECRHPETEEVTITIASQTNSTGYYHLLVEGDHENEICETYLTKSPKEDCSEIPDEVHTKESSRVTLTNNNGMAGNLRDANALFFLAKKVSSECAQEFNDMQYIPELKDVNQA